MATEADWTFEQQQKCAAEVEALREKVGNLEHALLAQRKVESDLRQMLDVARKDNKAGRLEKEVEALRAQLAETERNLTRANARLMQWESGEKERVGAHVLKADLQKRLAAAEQRAEKAAPLLTEAYTLLNELSPDVYDAQQIITRAYQILCGGEAQP